MNLTGFDLNLLLALDALLRERSVTRAARRLAITQPAMSNALARLRAAFGDPLFVRTKAAMVPTPRAVEIGRAASAALREIEGALGGSGFDPGSSERVFTIAASDYVSTVLLGPIVQQLAANAPGVTIRLVPLEPDLSLTALEAGTTDLTIGFYRRVPAGLHRLRLFADRAVAVLRAGHPALRSKLTLEDLAKHPHVRIAPQGERRGQIDIALAKRGMHRHVLVTSPHFLFALVAGGTDVIASLPERLARMLVEHSALEIVPLPVKLPPIEVDAYWHARAHHDAGHAWLRDLIAQSVRRDR